MIKEFVLLVVHKFLIVQAAQKALAMILFFAMLVLLHFQILTALVNLTIALLEKILIVHFVL